MILGAGVQGTLYAVRLVRVGHDVTVIARGMRAAELRRRVAHIEEALTSRTDTVQLPVKERLSPDVRADVCLVAVRREQISEVLPDLAAAVAIRRVVFIGQPRQRFEGKQVFRAPADRVQIRLASGTGVRADPPRRTCGCFPPARANIHRGMRQWRCGSADISSHWCRRSWQCAGRRTWLCIGILGVSEWQVYALCAGCSTETRLGLIP
jgi:hypothetical protein